MNEKFVKNLLNEAIYIGFIVMLSLNFTSSNNTERFVVLILVEVTFIVTRVYCKIKGNDERKKKFDKKGDKNKTGA